MQLNYIAQPSIQVGNLIKDLLNLPPNPTLVTFVSAFINRQTLLRYKSKITAIEQQGAQVRFVIGIDLDGTSKEAIEELLSWNVETRIVKHRRGGHTFHPKLFLIERLERADIIIGSNNLTEGGFFKNYEAGIHISFVRPQEETDYNNAKSGLSRFLDPQGPTALHLTADLLQQLVSRGDVPTEAEARVARGEALRSRRTKAITSPSPFGTEDIPSPPPIPGEVIGSLLPTIRAARKKQEEQAQPDKPITVQSPVELAPTSFYMTLPKMRGSIPGEARIPLDARDIAEEFWGWPDRYAKTTGSRGGQREYLNWKPRWKVWDAANPDQVSTEEVRMYEYVNSSDFRFYSSKLLSLGADEGDIVRITRIADNDAEFECILAKKNTQIYSEWIENCTEPVRNSSRRYGYA